MRHTANVSQYNATDDSAPHAWGPLARHYRDSLVVARGMASAFVSRNRLHVNFDATVNLKGNR